jgi:hypothetical protein
LLPGYAFAAELCLPGEVAIEPEFLILDTVHESERLFVVHFHFLDQIVFVHSSVFRWTLDEVIEFAFEFVEVVLEARRCSGFLELQVLRRDFETLESNRGFVAPFSQVDPLDFPFVEDLAFQCRDLGELIVQVPRAYYIINNLELFHAILKRFFIS